MVLLLNTWEKGLSSFFDSKLQILKFNCRIWFDFYANLEHHFPGLLNTESTKFHACLADEK